MKLLDDNGILRQDMEVDPVTKNFVVKTSQDISPHIESNKYQQQNARSKWKENSPVHRVASIPDVIVHKLMKEGIWNDPVALRQFLDDPDNRAFRCDNGAKKLGKVKSIVYA